MTLTELRYIVAVAQKKHFGQAAQSCFVSQPTLSIAIKKLEQELEVTLFERSSKNEIHVTEIGHQIIEQAQQVLQQTQVIKEIANQGKDPLSGPFRLGAIYTIGPYLFPPLIQQIRQTAPQLKLLIEENYTANLSQALKLGKLDAIIISYPFDEPSIETLALYQEPFVVAIPEQHEWHPRDHINTKDLTGQDLMLLGSGHCFRDQVIKACPNCMSGDSELTRTLEGGSLETMRQMVVAGTGITVLPCTSILPDDQNHHLMEVKPFAEPAPKRTVALAWRKKFPRKMAIDLIVETIKSCQLNGVLR